MNTKLKKLSDSRVEITVTLDEKDLKEAEKQALEKLSKEVRVEGFRKGKVPIDVAKRFIPENDLNAETADLAVRATVVRAFKENNKVALALPGASITKYVPGEVLEYTATADIIPDIKLGDYKNLGVKAPNVTVTEKDIKGVLDNIASGFAEKKVTKRAAKKGDEVIIDFVGKKDGKAFPGGSAKDFHLWLGSNALIPGFEDGVIGHEPGDKFELELTFPKDYGMPDLAGVKTVFEILVKQVSEVKLPEIDDELAKKAGPFEDLKTLKEDIKKNLTLQANQREGEKYKDELVKALVKKSKVSAPEILIDDQMHIIRDDFNRNAQSQGIDFEEYLKRSGTTKEEWEKEARKVATERVKASLVLQTLAVEKKITVSDEEVAAKVAELQDVYKKSPDALKQLKTPNVRMDIKNRLIIEKTLDFLVDANK